MSTKTCCWKQNKIELSFKIKFLELNFFCLQQDIPEQYLCGKRNQDIAYTGSYFFERYNEKEEK